MKYFKEGDILLSDFDGVYLDSQERYQKAMKEETSLEAWMKYLNSIDWPNFLEECEEMTGATETFKELQELKILRGFITQIHSFEEGIEKSKFIRKKGLYVPVIYVLPDQPKSMVYMPNKKTIILEDKVKNVEDWVEKGGKAILYNPKISESNKTMIKKLPDLLLK